MKARNTEYRQVLAFLRVKNVTWNNKRELCTLSVMDGEKQMVH